MNCGYTRYRPEPPEQCRYCDEDDDLTDVYDEDNLEHYTVCRDHRSCALRLFLSLV